MGLYYCKKTVEAHGGSITVNSCVGVGSEFVIKLPVGAGVDDGAVSTSYIDVVDGMGSGSF